jgi:hypothetical protein
MCPLYGNYKIKFNLLLSAITVVQLSIFIVIMKVKLAGKLSVGIRCCLWNWYLTDRKPEKCSDAGEDQTALKSDSVISCNAEIW